MSLALTFRMWQRPPAMSRAAGTGRRAKIICTLGPAATEDAQVEQLIRGGMDAARVNFSFGTVEEHQRRIEQVRRINESSGQRPVAVIADLPGRKPRLGRLEDGRAQLETGDVVRFVPDEDQVGDARSLPAPLAFFTDNMASGETVLLSDGVVELRTTRVGTREIEAQVVYGGSVGEFTGLHSMGMPLTEGPVTEKDRPYIEMAVAQKVDFLAVGWICDDTDILAVKEVLDEMGASIPIIAKIERPEAFARLDGILRRADAVMIRRGDLGAQIEVTRVPLVQKEILRLANQSGTPAIIATQMLGSMISAPRPTRAEASDVSNAVADGADGVLLSAETAVGNYPQESVEMMSRIIRETELERLDRVQQEPREGALGFADTTAGIAVEAADRAQAKLIVCFTESGRTAGLVSKYRPHMPILAFCSQRQTRRRLALSWGVRSDDFQVTADIDETVERVERRLIDTGLVTVGDRMVLVFGSPAGTPGRTNTVRLHRVGHSKGRPSFAG